MLMFTGNLAYGKGSGVSHWFGTKKQKAILDETPANVFAYDKYIPKRGNPMNQKQYLIIDKNTASGNKLLGALEMGIKNPDSRQCYYFTGQSVL
jgi:hypothetical protein